MPAICQILWKDMDQNCVSVQSFLILVLIR